VDDEDQEPGPDPESDEVEEHPDEGEQPPEGVTTALPPKLEAWRRRSAAGAILTGFALGLQEALETKREEPAIMVQTSGDPPKDLPVEADFEYGRPRQGVVSIRPWLLKAKPESPDSSEPGPGDRDGA
jgi:hypothetical protein